MAGCASAASTQASTRVGSSQSASRPSTQQLSSRPSTKQGSDTPRITHHDASSNRFMPVRLGASDLFASTKKRRTLTLDNTGNLRVNAAKHHTTHFDSSANSDSNSGANSGANSRQTEEPGPSSNRRTPNLDVSANRRGNAKAFQAGCRRSTVKATQPFGTTHLYRVDFGDLLFDNDVAIDAPGEEDMHERLVAFWRVSARCSQMQVPVNTVAVGVDSIDFFVSHVWQPPTMPRSLELEAYAMQKVEALMHFCLSRAALGSADTGKEDEAPWFLRDPATIQENEEENPANDPKHAWRDWQCWVDKACAVIPGIAAEATPNSHELVRTTNAALRSSKAFLAVVTWQYFSRLWCVFEWATFISRVGPHYRQIELVIPEACHTDGLWPQFIDTVASFSLAGVHTGSESDHPQLWRELEQIVVSTKGFERFMQATALALLARYALLLCTKQCPAFCPTITSHSQSGMDPLRLEPLIEACHKLEMHSLADALHSAKPRGWWNLAYRRAKEKKNTKAEKEDEDKIYTAIEDELRDDPMDRLWRALNKKVKDKKDDAASEKRMVSDSAMAANYAMQMISKQSELQDAVLGFSGSATEIQNRLSAKYHKGPTVQQPPPLQEHEATTAADGDDIDEEGLSRAASAGSHRKNPEQDWLQDFSRPAEGDAAVVVGKENIVGSSLSEILHPSEGTTSLNTRSFGSHLAPPVEMETPKAAPSCLGQDTGVAKTLFGGLPDGLGPFWRGLKGKPLSESERLRAKIFRNAWIGYRQLVDKWFDKHVCPKLEVWRQRGIRISSLLDETFGSSFLPLAGALQDVLCDNLTPKAREMFLAREPPPRGRPARCFDAPWDNPALNRLILMSGKHLDAERQGEIKKAPVLLLSSLPLKLATAPKHNLLCVRLVDSHNWKHVAVPQSLGAEALTNALRHLFEDKHITKLELEVVVPRLALKVRGLEGFESMRVVLGVHIFGVLRHTRRRKATLFQKTHEASLPISASTATLGTNENDSEDGDVAEALNWNRWKCSDTRLNVADDSSQSSEDGAVENSGKPGLNDGEKFQPRHGIKVSGRAQGVSDALQPVRAHTPRRASGEANRDFLQLAFEKARGNIMGFSKADLDSAGQCPAPKRNRRLMGAGGLLPHSAELALLQPPNLSKVPLAKVTKHVQRPRPRSTERLPQIPLDMNARHIAAGQEHVPNSARAQSAGANDHKDAERKLPDEMMQAGPPELLAQNLAVRQTWQWSVHAYGGAVADNYSWSGTFRDIFSQLQKWMDEARCHQWMPVDHVAIAHGRGFNAKSEEQVAVQPQRRTGNSRYDEEVATSVGIVQGPQCSFCGHTDVVSVQLDQSMLLHVWGVPACTVCLACSTVDKVGAKTGNDSEREATFDGDAVLEVCTAVLLRSGTASYFQQLASRVLRVDSEQVLVAAPVEDPNKAATNAKSRLAHISLCGRSTGISAAVVTACHRARQGTPDDGAYFLRDSDWVSTCLRDSGLDLKYGEDRPVAIDQAIGELDDRRTLPRRVDVSPLVLWVELQHLLSEDFDAFEWCRASLELLRPDRFSLVAAITMRQNAEKLRNTLGMQTVDDASGGTKSGREVQDEPTHWPLALHKAFFTEKGEQEELLGAALNGAGVHVGSPSELFAQGINLIAELHSDAISPRGNQKETKAFSSAVKAAGAWRSSMLNQTNNNNRSSLNKTGDAGDEGPRTKSASVMFQGLFNADAEDNAPQRRSDNRGRRMTLTNIGRRALDPAAVMRNLTYRRNVRGGDLGAEARALLRARRLLRLMQVSSFLTKLHERVTANDEWRFSAAALDDQGSDQESASDVSSSEDEEEDEAAKSDSTESAQKEPSKSVEELTVQKVLGHAKEYVHHADIVLKCLQVLNIIVQTCTTFLVNASALRGNRRRRGAANKSEAPPIERVALEQGFSRTAIRAIYRHWKKPEIGAEALKLLVHLLSGELQEDIYNRACSELSSPPEHVLTLIIAAGKFSDGGHADQLRSTLKVLLAIVTPECVPNLPVDREEEAASTLMSIMFDHEDEGDVFEMATNLISMFLDDRPLCEAFFNQGLNPPVRCWLKKSALGEVTSLWRSTVEEQTRDVKMGHSGIGAMHLRKRLSRINAVPVRVGRCEKSAWQILGKLVSGGSLCENYVEESVETIQHGVEELSRLPRTSQWSMALSCLSDLVLNHGEALAALFIQAGGLELMLAEIPDGEVPNVLPLILGLLTVEGNGPEPDKGPGETDDEDEAREMARARDRQMERRDSQQDIREQRRLSRRMSQGELTEEERLKLQDKLEDFPLVSSSSFGTHVSQMQENDKAPVDDADHGKAESPKKKSGLAVQARTFFTKNQAVTKCLDALEKYRRWPEIQTQLLAILANLFRGEDALIAVAMKDFEHSKGVLGGGLPEIFHSLKLHSSNKEVVTQALCLLTNLIQRRGHVAPRVADTEDSCELLMQVLWKHLSETDVRRRVLTCARIIRKAVPSSVDNLANAWTLQQRAHEEKQQTNMEWGYHTEKVPNDVKRFGALVYIHRYALTNGQRPIMEAVAPLRDHTRDKEIVSVGINAIMRGTEFMMKDRFKVLAEEGSFPATLNRILLLHPLPDIVLLVIQLLTGILDEARAQKFNYHKEDYAGTAAMALSTMFELTTEWTMQTWNTMLTAAEAVGRLEGGVEILERYEILDCIEDEWDALTDSDEENARLVIKSYHEETKRIIALLT